MRRTAGLGATVLPVLALVFAPWFGFSSPRSAPSAADVFFAGTPLNWLMSRSAEPERPTFARPEGGCNCRTVKVNMRNDVRRAEVRTGNAKVVNFNITYVSAAFGDREVDVDQEALAVSGDAVAGQLVNVDAGGPGCVNVEVNAVNRVRDSIVRSGDATAINKSIVLLDPGVSAGDLEIEVEQEAMALTGDAIAGQVIGLTSAGSGGGRCRGGIDLRAVNEVTGTKVRSGHATFVNEADVVTCGAPGCAEELSRLLGQGAELEVCTGSRCREVDAEDLGAVLDEAARADEPDREDDDEYEDEEEEEAVSARDPSMGCGDRVGEEGAARNRNPHRYWEPEETPAPSPSAMPAASASPTPTPTTRPGCPTPTPAPSPSLLAAPDPEGSEPAS